MRESVCVLVYVLNVRVSVERCVFFWSISVKIVENLWNSHTHIHTHKYMYTERSERERERDSQGEKKRRVYERDKMSEREKKRESVCVYDVHINFKWMRHFHTDFSLDKLSVAQ